MSQPAPNTTVTRADQAPIQRSNSRSLLRRRTVATPDPASDTGSSEAVSRGSSASRHRRFLSRTVDEADGASPTPSWLRRISMISTLSGSPTPSRPDTPAELTRAESTDSTMANGSPDPARLPNKLVKRSLSQRLLSSDGNRFPLLRRPVTVHQRSVESSPPSRLAEERGDSAVQGEWKPYFGGEAHQSRKRHTSGAMRQKPVRIVSDARGYRPALVLGTAVTARMDSDNEDTIESRQRLSLAPQAPSSRKIIPARSAGRRRFTEPVRSPASAPDTFARGKASPLSPISHVSTFDMSLSTGTPAFSDPTTAGSDQIFTDDDSMDFQSDTAYDSLATRATVSSHSGLRGLQIESVFHEHEAPVASNNNTLLGLEDLIREGSLKVHANSDETVRDASRQHEDPFVIMPEMHQGTRNASALPRRTSTPSAVDGMDEDDAAATPVPRRKQSFPLDINSSPPTILTPRAHPTTSPLRLVDRTTENLDWMSIDDDLSAFDDPSTLPDFSVPRHPSPRATRFDLPSNNVNDEVSTTEHRSSIFDWSEHLRLNQDQVNGSSPRPKTVHGKQDMELRGSRPVGRRGPSALHLRSQSVPVSREMANEADARPTTSKFGTWGMGYKGPKEEWSEDFELDDDEGPATLAAVVEQREPAINGSVRGVKVPQAIIDRQASVRGQVGQVQEFMALVEELKRLRQQGGSLQLLEDQSHALWEDAQSIVNLATLNDEDHCNSEEPHSPISRVSFEAFNDTNSVTGANRPERTGDSSELSRPTTGTVTPPAGRPRSESLLHAKSLLQDMHQKRIAPESSPAEPQIVPTKKLPFDTDDLRDLVGRARYLTIALKEIVSRAEGVSVSPRKSPRPFQEPHFSKIFQRPERSPPSPTSPTSPTRRQGMTKSRSANSHLGGRSNVDGEHEIVGNMRLLTVV